MPGSAVHAETPLNVLETTLQQLYTKKITLEVEDADKHKDQLTKIDAKILEYTAIIKTKKETTPAKIEPGATSSVAPQSSGPLGTAEAKFYYNSMLAHFKSNVPTLEPPLDVSIFIQRLQNCYNLFVKSFPALEPYFVQQAKSYLSMDILESINATEDKTETFEELQLYLKKNYGSRETPFQLLNSLLELELKEGEKLQEFAGRLERKIATVVTQITAKFKSQESNTTDAPMTASDCFNLFGSMIFYDHLRKKRPNCFNLMVKDVDNCWKPSDLGSMAATLVDRMDIPEHSQAANQSFSARPNSSQQKSKRKQNKVAPQQSATSKGAPQKIYCGHFLKHQKCKFQEKCKYKHLSPGDEEYAKACKIMKIGQSTTPQPNQPSNANVATAKSNIEELQPQDVGLDFFGLYNAKN